MSTRLWSLVVDAADPAGLARFWSEALRWPIVFSASDEDEVVVAPAEQAPGHEALGLVFVPVPEPKTAKNRIHLDLATTSREHQEAEVVRLRELGAEPVDIGQGDEVPWVVLADPEGNELCVLDPRPEYLATGPIAAIVVDCADPASMTRFWVDATGWSVVAADDGDDGDSASLRASSASGPSLEILRVPDAKSVKNRWHLDVAPNPGDDQEAEVARLEKLGATRVDIGQGDVSWVVLADPEGQELCVLSTRKSLLEVYGS